ncbi:MAG: hypothetical protein ACXWMN_03000 [Candidatus Limnocylindria bacterium]
MQRATPTVLIVTCGDLAANVISFARQMPAANLSPATQRTYLAALDRLADFLEPLGMPTSVAAIRREHQEQLIPCPRTGSK